MYVSASSLLLVSALQLTAQIDTLSETLQRECGTFSQPGDVVVYKVRASARFDCSG